MAKLEDVERESWEEKVRPVQFCVHDEESERTCPNTLHKIQKYFVPETTGEGSEIATR